MSKRKTAQQRIEEYRIKADKLEAAAKLRALRNSPAWKATFKAIESLEDAVRLLDLAPHPDGDHSMAVRDSLRDLVELRVATFGS